MSRRNRQDLRSLLEDLEERGELIRIRREVSPIYEAPSLIIKLDERPGIIERISGSRFKVLFGLCRDRDLVARSLGIGKEDLLEVFLDAMRNLREPRVVRNGPVKERFEDKPNLLDLPVMKHFERDGYRYITSSIVIAKDPDTGVRNASFHRIGVISERRATLRIVPRHLFNYFSRAEERGEPLEVAIVIGVHPAVMLAAATSLPFNTDELSLAASLLGGLDLVRCETVDLEVPAYSEIVLEGRIIPKERAREGPFVDITRTYDVIRDQPVLEITGMNFREDALYYEIIPSGREHRFLMGFPREALIYDYVSKIVPEVRGVCLTSGGCGWLHAVISIRKRSEGDPKNVIMAAFAAHPSLKHVIVVDDDIDPFNPEEVEWAIATRFRADRDLLIVENVRGSSLDPVASQEGLTAKMGIDATKPLGEDQRKFERARPPLDLDPKDYLERD